VKRLDYRDFVTFLEKDDDLKTIDFTKTAFLLKKDAKNCCKCVRKQKVTAFQNWVAGANKSLSQEEKNLILEKKGENFVVHINGNDILEI
jgi:hypothetical protein|tara:strand:- start:364 stop:633 length:270 start_codon:yes stop_codon:yes gene_type:complete